MRKRSDPLVPILGSLVALVVIGAIGLIFYPRIKRWLGPEKASIGGSFLAPDAAVPVWVCRSVEGVALLLETHAPDEGLDDALSGGPYRYLRLSVYNFGRDETLGVPLGELRSPEKGPAAVPAADRLRNDLEKHQRTVLRGMGAVRSLSVRKGHRGQALFVLPDAGQDAPSGGFALGAWMFERKELERVTLAKWRARPTLKQFLDF